MEHTGSTGKPGLRFAAALLLLVPTVFFTWRTWDELAQRRELRTELAEIGHVRYGLFNADQWVARILPILNARIDALDLTAKNRDSLRPVVEKMLNRLLDQVKDQVAPKPAPGASGGGFAAQAAAFMANTMINGLRPRVPEFARTVLTDLGSKENKEAIKKYLANALAEGAKNTFSPVDMTWYSNILKQNGCADAPACRTILADRIKRADADVTKSYLSALGLAALGFALVIVRRRVLRWFEVLVLLLFCVTLLAGGIFSPMLEVEAKISRIDLTFFGQPVSFGEQVLYYQSKTVLEVFRTLIDVGKPEMWVVAVLLLTFSVVFPTLKILTLGFTLGRPDWLRKYRIVRFFALESSKWSMADVMALAIFMSFVAFNGVISSALDGLQAPGTQIVVPTNSSQILAGFYLFVGFVVASLFLSWKLGKDLATYKHE